MTKPKCSHPGGAEEDRTPDPLRARQVLSQLSYDPILPASTKTNCVDTLKYLYVLF